MSAFWADDYQRHFQHYFSKPFDIQVYHDASGAALKLATYDLARHGFRVYASIGLADKLFLSEEKDFGEAILYSDVPDRDVTQIFITALFLVVQHHIPLRPPFAISFGGMNTRFAERYGKTALYFSRPAERDDEVEKGDAIGRVFQAYFITAEEDAFLEKNGPEAFELEFWKQFSGEMTEEDLSELAVLGVDKAKAAEVDARIAELAQRTSRALSVYRRSCV